MLKTIYSENKKGLIKALFYVFFVIVKLLQMIDIYFDYWCLHIPLTFELT